MNIGLKKQLPSSKVGNKKSLPSKRIGEKRIGDRNISSVVQSRDISEGMENESNNKDVVNEPIKNYPYKPYKRAETYKVEKSKRSSRNLDKYSE